MGRRRRSKVRRIVNLARKLIAFFFSHIGLCALVIGYTLLGAFVFRVIELPHELIIQDLVRESRGTALREMWLTTFDITSLNGSRLSSLLMAEVDTYRKALLTAIREGYVHGKDTPSNPQWTMSGAFLYALTVITTIGYGHTAPRTYFGKAITILYAIIGIPLMLLFLTNVGDILAKVFRFAFGRCILWQKELKNCLTKRRSTNANRMVQRHHSSRSYQSGIGGRLVYANRNVDDVARLKHEVSSSGSLNGGDAAAAMDESTPFRDEQVSVRSSEQAALHGGVPHTTVPISVILLVMACYLMLGAVLFCLWESWDFLDGFYFCFISLTTIGFGDLVPGATFQGENAQTQEKLVICSLYLLFGMALIAMCFNLAQEEVVNKVTRMAIKLGMIKTQPIGELYD